MVTTEQAEALARGWIEAWIRMDLDWLRSNLVQEFTHTSPLGRLAGRDAYLAAVAPIAQTHVHELAINTVIASGDHAAIWFENRTPSGVVPSCDWVTIADTQIAAVRSFFDSTRLREVLSPAELRALGGDN